MPNRIIKESICTSESLNQLSDFEENLFYKLIVNCDDYGLFDGRMAIIKSRCYPLRERLTLKTLEDAILQLARVGCVELYSVDGKPYLRLPSWESHQQVRAKKSRFPAHDTACNQMISSDIKCYRNPIQSESLSESPPLPPTGEPKKTRKEEIKEIWDSYELSEGLQESVKQWGKYKKENGKEYKPQGLKSLLSQIRSNADKYGEGTVITLINESMASGYQGITWDKLARMPKAQAAKSTDALSGLDKRLMDAFLHDSRREGTP